VLARPVLVGFVAASILLVAGCSSDKPRDTSATPPLPSAPSSVAPSLGPSAAAELEALTAYRGMWDAFVEAAKTSDTELPALREHATDNALALIASALISNREQKRVILGELKIDPKVTAVTPADAPREASVVDCVNDEKWLVHKASGGLVNDVPGSANRTTATVIRTDDGWRVSRFTIEDTPC
jgi:hypothetical protein